MRSLSEPPSIRARLLQDIGSMATLSVVLIPLYLLLNQYWKSLLLLFAAYTVLGLGFLRIGRHIRRVMRRAPAEIPPWRMLPQVPGSAAPAPVVAFGAAEAIRNVYQDPHYLQEIMKPRLCRLLTYRLCGRSEADLGMLDDAQLERIEPLVLDFLQRREETHIWAKYRERQQRVRAVLGTLRYLETL